MLDKPCTWDNFELIEDYEYYHPLVPIEYLTTIKNSKIITIIITDHKFKIDDIVTIQKSNDVYYHYRGEVNFFNHNIFTVDTETIQLDTEVFLNDDRFYAKLVGHISAEYE